MRAGVYSFMYKTRLAIWAGSVWPDLKALVESGRLTPDKYPRVIDLGCGVGENAIYLAQRGFEVTGVDFAQAALERSRKDAAAAGVADRCKFVWGDLTAPSIEGAEGPFDLAIDFGTLDDLSGDKRAAMARTVHRVTKPGSVFVEWCVHHDGRLPLNPKGLLLRLHPHLFPGEEKELFGDGFDIERLPTPPPESLFGCFLMTRR
ncbi:SAM-dependent methyltransferase [Amycolatopsis sp. lyj-90]|uniref:SAM-dependent methyltransferase n=1 Tax=Amycolatopsis sp. lyj-90 TaxID=2789285 RepID=UPI00397C59EC